MKNKYIQLCLSAVLVFSAVSCGKDYLTVDIKGKELTQNFYQTEEEIFQGLVAVYDVLGWNGTNGWTMLQGLLNAASDDCYAGGSDASDQPSWVAWDQFTLRPDLGPQEGLWNKNFAGIRRANLILEKLDEAPSSVSEPFKKRVAAEAKFLRAWFYFDLVRLFGNVPLYTRQVSVEDLNNIKQAKPAEIYAQIENDLRDAYNTFELPETVPPEEVGRITHGAVTALWGKVILFQNDESRMLEAADLFMEVINSGLYFLEPNYGDIFKRDHEWGPESIFEIQYSDNKPGDWGCCFASGPNANATEGNYNVQFYGMRDYVGPVYAPGWSFCPVTPDLVEFMQNDPRFEYTIIDGKKLKELSGASYTEGFQNTDYFIKKYAPIDANKANDGVIPLEWGDNERVIRLADVYLMAAEALVRGGGDEALARSYLNKVRVRVALQPYPGSFTGDALLDAIYKERRLELATEGHRFWDLVRTGRAAEVLENYQDGVHQWLPIPQIEIDLTQGQLVQNPGY
ncbi:MAG: RagB/SusD family nutrient uptake outer membrane protein [Bacteroidetes bacterium]|nr:MAG: RagB/SusD family nutrient uptake outer membrane protein [Bacteroidota bacterium]